MRTRELRATPREGRPAPPTKLYTYRGAKTEARSRHFAALERHSAECIQRSQEPATPPMPKPETSRPQEPLPPPLYGGPEGLEAAADEIAAFSRNAPKNEWPELPAQPTPEGATRHEITHPDTNPLPEPHTGNPEPPERHNTPLRSSKSRARRLLGWAAESFHAGARAFREARLEGSQGRGSGSVDRGREPARG